ncbi:MAG: hypothetical protein OEZ38_04000 [Gammaproteobacteria bacterium]|nr:hypothetical protein [Gammaproteobacteria bacterium]
MTFLKVLAFSILAVIAGVLVTTLMEPAPSLGFPWQVEQQPDGSTQIFKIQLGHTTLGEAEKLFQNTATLTLFSPPGSDPVVEAYFNELFIGGLKAKMVLTFDIEQQAIAAMYERGIRISTLGSGTRKVTLHSDDEAMMRQQVINSMTYLPSINLQAGLIEKRFGEPTEKLIDAEGGAEHWLYPDTGVDIALHAEQKEVIQYVLPADFDKIKQPLLENRTAE